LPLAAIAAAVALSAIPAVAQPMPPPLPPYEPVNGNGAIQVVIPAVLPTLFQFVSQRGMDATLVIRTTTLLTTSWYDATAPYHPTAVGMYSRLGRRPASESVTNENLNAALITASYRVLNSMYPLQAVEWRNMMIDAGLDPDDDSEDLTTAVGLGNVAGRRVVEVREQDGMNQLGDVNRTYNRRPYSDYTGYEPRNSAYSLRDPSRWQPALTEQLNGLSNVQSFVTPQYALTEPYSYSDPDVFHVPPPRKSDWKRNKRQYREQAAEVLRVSGQINDLDKMEAEFFNNKIDSLGFSALFAALSRGLSLMDFIHLDFLTNMAAFDTGIIVWQEKTAYDAVRPFSAIRFLYRGQTVSAHVNGQGIVNDLPGEEWTSYLPVADHPEYPSGTAAFCGAHTTSARLFFGGDDTLGWPVTYAPGSAAFEAGTPAAPTTLFFPTWSDFEARCGYSRVKGGVHFEDALEPATLLGRDVGAIAYDYFVSLRDGTIGDDDDDDDDDDCRPGRGHGRGRGRGHRHH
jgi:hypothetical protein